MMRAGTSRRTATLTFLAGLLLTGLTQAASNSSPDLRLVETSSWFARHLIENHNGLVEPVSDIWNTNAKTAMVLVEKETLATLSKESHELTHRCGGFMDVTDESPMSLIFDGDEVAERYSLPSLNRKREIADALNEVRSSNLEGFVNHYTRAFRTRKAGTTEGDKAPAWLAKTWQDMADKLNPSLGVKVETFRAPRGYNQPNVRVTIPGTDPSLPIVVMGGHLDSINWRDGDSAPGADDDASGISALTEALRVILVRDIRPKATIQIFGYAAEELGLLGSRAIAEYYQKQGVKVRGALQLDMVGFPGASRKVTFIMDHTDHELTVWTQQLYGTYVGGEIQEDTCGYGCSDHASWARYGYASVFPFEASTGQMNSRIHTTRDVWDDQLDAEYAAQFAKLAVAFAAELSEAYQ